MGEPYSIFRDGRAVIYQPFCDLAGRLAALLRPVTGAVVGMLGA
jgi:hypothetical protein